MVLNPDDLTTTDIERAYRAATSHATGRSIRDRYLQGDVLLDTLGIKIPRELDIFRTVMNYTRIYLEAQLDRMTLEGFRVQDTKANSAAAKIYGRCNMAEEAYLVILEALAQKRAYLIIGVNEDGKPIITTHTAQGIHAEHNSITREVKWAFQTWGDGRRTAREGTLYLPGVNVDYKKISGVWVEQNRRPTGLDKVAVVGVINRAALGDFRGRSEMDTTRKFTDAAARTLTNLQIAGESVALPHRSFFGVDKDSKPANAAEAMAAFLSRTSYYTNPEGKAIQLPGADLRGFLDTMQAFHRMVAAQTGLPVDYLGISSDNPSSAEAITRGEARLIKKVQRKMALFGEAFEQAMRLALQLEGHTGVEIEAVWQAPETPNLAGVTDSVTKLRSPGPDGKPLISADTARRMLGMSPEARAREADAVDDEFVGIAA